MMDCFGASFAWRRKIGKGEKINLAICIFPSSYIFISRWLVLVVTEKKVVILLLALCQTGTNCSSWYGNITGFPLWKETFHGFQTLKTTQTSPLVYIGLPAVFQGYFCCFEFFHFFCNTEQLIILVYVNSKVHRTSKSERVSSWKRNPLWLLKTKTPPFLVPELLVKEDWNSILGRFHSMLSLVVYSFLPSALGHCWEVDSCCCVF